MTPQEIQQLRANLAEEGVSAEVSAESDQTNGHADTISIRSHDEGGGDTIMNVMTMTGWLNERQGGRVLGIVLGLEYTDPDTDQPYTYLKFKDESTAVS